jgi:hypothetical protein
MQDSAKPTNRAIKRNLTIRSVPDGFVFRAATSKEEKTTTLDLPAPIDFPDLFEEYLEDNGWAHRNNLPVYVIDFSNRFLLLPSDMTGEEDIRAFFQFQYPQETAYQIYTARLDDNKQTFCWEIPVKRDEQFERLFPEMSLLASCYLLANWTYQQATQSTVLTAHFYGNILQVFAAAPGKLIFANSFPVNNLEEGQYFLLRCMEQLKLNARKTLVYLSSEGTPVEDWHQRLEPYLAHISYFKFTLQPDEPIRIVEPNTTQNENR